MDVAFCVCAAGCWGGRGRVRGWAHEPGTGLWMPPPGASAILMAVPLLVTLVRGGGREPPAVGGGGGAAICRGMKWWGGLGAVALESGDSELKESGQASCKEKQLCQRLCSQPLTLINTLLALGSLLHMESCGQS